MSDAGGGGWTPIDHGTAVPSRPPGWYPDPWGPGGLRWWDGNVWSAHTQPVQPVAWGAPPPAPSSGRAARGFVIAGAFVVVALGIVGLLAVAQGDPGPRPSASASPPGPAAPTTVPTADVLRERARAAGVPVLPAEGAVTHTHTIVHVMVDGGSGRDLPLPSSVGRTRNDIAAVHTHDATGVVHVESPNEDDRYTVGQFLTLLTGETDPGRICAALVPAPCTISIAAAEPTEEDRALLRSYAGSAEPAEVELEGLDTVLAPGADLEVRIRTAS